MKVQLHPSIELPVELHVGGETIMLYPTFPVDLDNSEELKIHLTVPNVFVVRPVPTYVPLLVRVIESQEDKPSKPSKAEKE